MKFRNGDSEVGSVLVYKLARGLFDIVFFFGGGIKGVGVENVPETGGVIISSNHVTHLDAPGLSCTMRHRRLLAMAKEELFRNKVFGWIVGQIGSHPVKRGEGDTESIRWCLAQLKANHALLVFPEGTRGDGKALLPMARGVAMLAKNSGVPVVPVGVIGTTALWPRDGSKPRRQRVVIAYGKPLLYSDFQGEGGEKQAREAFLLALETSIRNLCAEHGMTV